MKTPDEPQDDDWTEAELRKFRAIAGEFLTEQRARYKAIGLALVPYLLIQVSEACAQRGRTALDSTENTSESESLTAAVQAFDALAAMSKQWLASRLKLGGVRDEEAFEVAQREIVSLIRRYFANGRDAGLPT